MNEELEQSLDVASESPSSSPTEQSSDLGSDNSEKLSSSPESKPDNTPFHEHPRFKELIQQRNEFSTRIQDYEKRLQEMSQRMDQSSKAVPKAEENKLLARLKGIDPEFGEWAEKRESVDKELADLKEWKAQSEKANYNTQAQSTVDKLKSESKVADVLHQSYLAQIPYGTPVADIAKIYKSLHDNMSKYLESQKRAELATYATAKKADSSVPGALKGAAPKAALAKPTFSRDPEEARSQIVKRAMEQARNNKNN